jgi:hypothetical protein
MRKNLALAIAQLCEHVQADGAIVKIIPHDTFMSLTKEERLELLCRQNNVGDVMVDGKIPQSERKPV